MLIQTSASTFWQHLAADPTAAPLIARVREQHDRNAEGATALLRYGQRRQFYEDGERGGFERPYFARRRFLTAAALLALLYPEDPTYPVEVQDMAIAICEETCWAVPAHTSGVPQEDADCIDLFAAETGMMLAEIRYVLGDRLDAAVCDRIAAEVLHRIRDNYRTHTYAWETRTTNWASVCAANVGGALLYLDPEAFSEALPRLQRSFTCFLNGFSDDGVCLEGLAYWMFGFGEYVWFADLLYRSTDGATDLLAGEKIRRIAAYGQSIFLRGGATVSFSDSSRCGYVDRALQNYLHGRFPDTVALLPETCTDIWTGNCSWLQLSRTLLYGRGEGEENARVYTPGDADFPCAGQAVVHRPGYALAVKAGYNDEPHNHNDIGSFIVATERGQVLCDLGSGRYTGQYFDLRYRYTFLCTSSFGHSVPIVNGQGQAAGRQYAGQLRHEGDTLCLELAGAYAVPALHGLTRTLITREHSIRLEDRFAGDGLEIVERFVTLLEPQLTSGAVQLPGVCLRFALSDSAVYIHAEQDKQSCEQPIYCIDFHIPAEQREFALDIECAE